MSNIGKIGTFSEVSSGYLKHNNFLGLKKRSSVTVKKLNQS